MTSRISKLLSLSFYAGLVSVVFFGSGEDGMASREVQDVAQPKNFGQNVAFLRQFVETLVLGAEGGPQLAIVPAWQGRVMDSSVAGAGGMSHGWLNYDLIEAGIKPEAEREGLQQKIHAMGGEDRFWIGPEGGQYSWYFPAGSDFTFDHWHVPAFIDTLPWAVSARSESSVTFTHRTKQTNWSGVSFDLAIDREILLLDRETVEKVTGIRDLSGVNIVGYESRNRLKNAGDFTWNQKTGMPSIWILGMMHPGDQTQIVIPVTVDRDTGDRDTVDRDTVDRDTADRHTVDRHTVDRDIGDRDTEELVEDSYFGPIPADRLKQDKEHGFLYFRGDGQFRSKIGVKPEKSRGLAGSWDPQRNLLTIVQYNQPGHDQAGRADFVKDIAYVNSLWEHQDDPFSGDAINSYNDGPIDGDQLGPFYEIETSSPALSLAPGEHYTHIHRTLHFEGERKALDKVARYILGTDLAAIESGGADTTTIKAAPERRISVGRLTTIHKMAFAYDHAIIHNAEEQKWHLYGIHADTRSFIHLTADSLDQAGWARQKPDFRYKDKAIWAPHIVKKDDLYYMVYTSIGIPREIRYAISPDLYHWTHPENNPLIAYSNDQTDNQKTKDPMLFFDQEQDQWIMYHSMLKDDKHWVVGYSTSADLVSWQGPNIAFDEHTQSPNVESPFVVKRGDYYYLMLSARPWPLGGQDFFRSKTPYHWNARDFYARINPWHAGELIQDEDGQWYLSRSSGEGSDFRIAPIEWHD